MYQIVYQAYGSEGIIYEAIFSILSLIKQCNGVVPNSLCIVIYTDKPTLFQNFLSEIDLQYRILNTAQINAWKGTHFFVHRVKIKVLEDLFSSEPKATLYVDTDTIFIKNPLPVLDAIANGQAMMHQPEYYLNEPRRAIRKIAIAIKASLIPIPSRLQMWNAGAIGLPTGSASFINDWLSLTDRLLDVKTLHVMEQLACTYLLAQKGNIARLDDYIYHYWELKEFRVQLTSLFKINEGKHIAQLLALTNELNPMTMLEEKKRYKKLNWLGRTIHYLKANFTKKLLS